MPQLDTDLLNKLNEQIANELHASHLYLAMSAYFEAEDLPGFAAWMRAQADEERDHAMKFYDHIHDRGDRVELSAIDKPPAKYRGPSDVFAQAHAHEQKVTGQIYELYEAAREGKDYALMVFLNWFVSEQMEEENTFETVLARIKRVEKEATGLMLLDKEMGERAASGS